MSGVALLVVLIPIQGVLQVSLMRYRGQANKHTDARIKLTNEILQGKHHTVLVPSPLHLH